MRDERQQLIRDKLQELGYYENHQMDDSGFTLWFGPNGAAIILTEYKKGGFELFGLIELRNSIEKTVAALEEYTQKFI